MRLTSLLVLTALAGCPGDQEGSRAGTPVSGNEDGRAEAAAETSTSDAGADGTGMLSTDVAGETEREVPPPDSWQLLEGCDGNSAIPVFWLGGHVCENPGPERAGWGHALHVTGPARAEGGDLNTHHHFDWTRPYDAIRFWARSAGEQPTEVVVAITEILGQDRGFHIDQKAGRAWRGKRVAVTGEWRLYTVAFEDFTPLSVGEPVPTYGPAGAGGSEIHFVFPADRAYDLWLDEIALSCRSDDDCP